MGYVYPVVLVVTSRSSVSWGGAGGGGEAETRCKKSNRKFCLVLNVRFRGRCDAAVSSRVLLLSRVVLLTTLE